MSEQEKKNAIAAEGTVEETPKKDPWYIRLYRNPITKKVLRITGVVGGIIGAGFGGYELGIRTAIPGGKWHKLEETEESEPERIEEAETVDE